MNPRQPERRKIDKDGRPVLSAIEAGLIARIEALEKERDELVDFLRLTLDVVRLFGATHEYVEGARLLAKYTPKVPHG